MFPSVSLTSQSPLPPRARAPARAWLHPLLSRRVHWQPWAFMTSFHFIVFKRSTLLLLGLAGATWAAAAITCHKVTWFDGMSCSPSGTRCLSNVDCSNKVWDRSSCFNGFCVDESPDMHVLCTGKCTYIMMETIIDVIAANLFLVIYWCGWSCPARDKSPPFFTAVVVSVDC